MVNLALETNLKVDRVKFRARSSKKRKIFCTKKKVDEIM